MPLPLTSVLPILGHSVLLGGQLSLCHQCPREGQEPRGARGLHAGGVGSQREGGCVVGEVLKLLLLKEKEQMVLDVEEAAAAMPGPPIPAGCDAKLDGMRRGWGGGRGAAQAGSHPAPAPSPCGLPGLSLSTAQPLLFSLWTLFFSFHPRVPPCCRQHPSTRQSPSQGSALPCSVLPEHPTPSGHPGKSLHRNGCIKTVKTLTSLITAGPEPPGRRDSLPTARQCNSPRRCC